LSEVITNNKLRKLALKNDYINSSRRTIRTESSGVTERRTWSVGCFFSAFGNGPPVGWFQLALRSAWLPVFLFFCLFVAVVFLCILGRQRGGVVLKRVDASAAPSGSPLLWQSYGALKKKNMLLPAFQNRDELRHTGNSLKLVTIQLT
jgi:hypothetical protein